MRKPTSAPLEWGKEAMLQYRRDRAKGHAAHAPKKKPPGGGFLLMLAPAVGRSRGQTTLAIDWQT
ncbi:hypothetical protein AVXHC19_29270 [Acidovorax sacchari]